MRVALVLDRFDPKHGGLEHWAFQLATWLMNRAHEVHIVAAQCGCRTTDARLILHPLGSAESRIAVAEKMEQYLKQLPVDVIHDLGSGWYYDVLQPQFGTKWADHLGNLRSLPWFKRPKYLWKREHRIRLRDAAELERQQYSRLDGQIIAVSQMTLANLRHFYQIPAEQTTVIHNGVDPNRFSPEVSHQSRTQMRRQLRIDDKVVLIFAGHNFQLKGLETVIRALKRVRERRLHLIVIGRESSEKWQGLASRLGIADQVSFCGFVPEVEPYYAAADAFVQPTCYDPCSLVTLEAAAFGLPVVTSRFNGAAELFTHGTNGWIAHNPRNDREVAGYLQALLDDESRQKMGAAAREVAVRNTAEGCFERIFQIYLKVSRERRQRGHRAEDYLREARKEQSCLD